MTTTIERKLFLSLALKRAKLGDGSSIDFLTTRTWNSLVSNLHQVFSESRFVIVDGVATRLYMPERMTLDLNIAVAKCEAS